MRILLLFILLGLVACSRKKFKKRLVSLQKQAERYNYRLRANFPEHSYDNYNLTFSGLKDPDLVKTIFTYLTLFDLLKTSYLNRKLRSYFRAVELFEIAQISENVFMTKAYNLPNPKFKFVQFQLSFNPWVQAKRDDVQDMYSVVRYCTLNNDKVLRLDLDTFITPNILNKLRDGQDLIFLTRFGFTDLLKARHFYENLIFDMFEKDMFSGLNYRNFYDLFFSNSQYSSFYEFRYDIDSLSVPSNVLMYIIAVYFDDFMQIYWAFYYLNFSQCEKITKRHAQTIMLFRQHLFNLNLLKVSAGPVVFALMKAAWLLRDLIKLPGFVYINIFSASICVLIFYALSVYRYFNDLSSFDDAYLTQDIIEILKLIYGPRLKAVRMWWILVFIDASIFLFFSIFK